MTIPEPNANSVLLTIAMSFTVLVLLLAKGYFSNGDSGPTGTLTQRAQASLTLLNSIGLLAVVWIIVFLGSKAATTIDRLADYVERQELKEARTNAGINRLP